MFCVVGKPMATVHDVCKLASVSPSTVSRVLNGSTKISEATRRRVIEAIKKLDYRPDPIAKALVTQKSNTFGLIIPKGLPAFSLIMQSIDEASCAASRYQKFLLSSFASEKPGSPLHALNSLVNLQCEGILYMHNYLYESKHGVSAQAIDDYINHARIPIIALDMKLDHMHDSCIWFDHQSSAALPVNYLVQHGHRHIAYVATYSEHRSAVWRQQGFESGLALHELPIDHSLFLETSVNCDGGYKAGLELIQRKGDFSAVCCFNDKIAIGISQAFAQHAPDLYRDVILFGFGNDPLLQFLPKKIHSLSIPLQPMITAGVQLLLQKMHINSCMDNIQTSFLADLVLND